MTRLLLTALTGLVALLATPAAAAPPEGTPNAFYVAAAGAPTLVVGTLGDDISDHSVRTQVAIIATLFPHARIVDDTAVIAALDAGEGWPPHAVLYGGPHVNAVTARIADGLPLQLTAGRLVLGGRSFDGPAYQLIAAIPRSDDHPELLLYAGTGRPGVTEINSVHHGGEPILVTDAFGRLVTGRWTRVDGAAAARLDTPAPRVAWRSVVRELAGSRARAAIRVHFADLYPAEEDEDALVTACVHGLQRAVTRLHLAAPRDVDVYVYPGHGAKRTLTGDGGDGHAVVAMGVLHVNRGDQSPAGHAALEGLIAHEGTHVLAHAAWGAAGTPLMGEGLAVWVSGRYGGKTLSVWGASPPAWPPVEALLGAGFRRLPERVTYPMSGLLVGAAVDQVGLEKVRRHLYGALPGEWKAACERAGTTSAALEAALPR